MSDFTILQDDREKKPWDFSGYPVDVETARLDVGDYTTPSLEGVAAVERKSLNDLATSVGSDRKRFKDEIRRAESLLEFRVVIEEPRHLVQTYADRGSKHCPHYYSRIYPNSVVGTVDSWPTKYNVEFDWNIDRSYATLRAFNLLADWEAKYA